MCAKFSFPLVAYNPLKQAPDKRKGTGDKDVAVSQIPRTGAPLDLRKAPGTEGLGPKWCNSDFIIYTDWLSVTRLRRVTSHLVSGFPRVQFLQKMHDECLILPISLKTFHWMYCFGQEVSRSLVDQLETQVSQCWNICQCLKVSEQESVAWVLVWVWGWRQERGSRESYVGLPCWLSGKESACQSRRHMFDPWAGKIPSGRKWQPTPVFLPGESHGRRSLVGSMGSQRVRHDWSNLAGTYAISYG